MDEKIALNVFWTMLYNLTNLLPSPPHTNTFIGPWMQKIMIDQILMVQFFFLINNFFRDGLDIC
jgi:hypothetical protein